MTIVMPSVGERLIEPFTHAYFECWRRGAKAGRSTRCTLHAAARPLARLSFGALILVWTVANATAALAVCEGKFSGKAGDPVDVPFHNVGNIGGELHWIDRQGNWIPYSRIEPGGTLVQPTFVGHSWVFRSDDGTCSPVIVDHVSAGGVSFAYSVVTAQPTPPPAQPNQFGRQRIPVPEEPQKQPSGDGRNRLRLDDQPASVDPLQGAIAAPQQGGSIAQQPDLSAFVAAILRTDAWVRLGPGKKFDHVTSLGAGIEVMVQCDRSWCQMPNGHWISKGLLSFPGGQSVTTPQPRDNGSSAQSAAAAADFAGKWTLAFDGSSVSGEFTQAGSTLQGAFVDSGGSLLAMSGHVEGQLATVTIIPKNNTASLEWRGQLLLDPSGQQLSGRFVLQDTNAKVGVTGQRTQ